MATPIPYDYRLKIIEMRKKGTTFHEIASSISYSERSIKRIWKRYKENGIDGLYTTYNKSGRKSSYSDSIKKQIKDITDPNLGAPYVRSVLIDENPQMIIPHERTIQRWWKEEGLNRPRGKMKQKSNWTTKPNHTWQIDGKEQIELGNGDKVSWMKVADEATGSDLFTQLSPLNESC